MTTTKKPANLSLSGWEHIVLISIGSTQKKFYDATTVSVPEAKVKAWPADTNPIGFHDCAEMGHPYWDTNGQGTPLGTGEGAYFSGHQSEMRRAYYGCLSYVDDLLGSAINMIDDNGLQNETVIIWSSDHGWHLGEHDLWCKMTTLELGTRVPLIIRAPWRTVNPGVPTDALAELVDVYPTLVDLAGIKMPTGEAGAYLTGTSLAPILEGKVAQVKDAALAQFPRCWQNNTHYTGSKPGDERNRTNSFMSMSDCHWTQRHFIDFMGYKMRTHNMSITVWTRWDGANLRPDWNETIATELYSHVGDNGMAPAAFDDYENVNLASRPEYGPVLKTLRAKLIKMVEGYIAPFTPTK